MPFGCGEPSRPELTRCFRNRWRGARSFARDRAVRVEMPYQQIGARDHGYADGQQARRCCRNEQEREDQRERPDQQEHQEQPRAQHVDDGWSEEGWGADQRSRLGEHFAPGRAAGRSGARRPRGDGRWGRRLGRRVGELWGGGVHAARFL